MQLNSLFCAALIGGASARYENKEVDAVVIGAGYSGLAAANELSKAGKSFAVVEALDRVGGRVFDVPVPGGGVMEMGAQFVGPTQDRVLALAKELGLKLYPSFEDGKTLFHRRGKTTEYSAGDFDFFPSGPVSSSSAHQAEQCIEKINYLAKELDVKAPWKHPKALEWDSMTFQDFLDSCASSSDAKFLVDWGFRIAFTSQAHELSFLYTLNYIAAGGNKTSKGSWDRIVGTTDGAQESRVVGGTYQLATKLAKKIGKENIYLHRPVRRIVRSKGCYIVHTDKDRFRASNVIVAMSPPLAARINYSPPLPANRDQLTQRMPMGEVAKAIAIYKEPWWRKKGLNGQVLSDSGICRCSFDNTPHDESFGALLCFIEADEMVKANELPAAEVKKRIVSNLVKYFGPEAKNTSTVLLQRWSREEYARGGYAANMPPGVLTNYGPYLRKRFQGIHFAGTEASEFWPGYMDGAIRAGERAAREAVEKPDYYY